MQMYGPKQGLRTLPRAKSQIFLEALFRSLYIIKRFRRRRRIKNPEGGGGGGGGRRPDYSVPPRPDLFEVWVCSTPPILGSRG